VSDTKQLKKTTGLGGISEWRCREASRRSVRLSPAPLAAADPNASRRKRKSKFSGSCVLEAGCCASNSQCERRIANARRAESSSKEPHLGNEVLSCDTLLYEKAGGRRPLAQARQARIGSEALRVSSLSRS
jgi:hypothetical protein